MKRSEGLTSRLVIFREFNKAHARLIAISHCIYFSVVIACVVAAYVFGWGALALLNVVLAASVAAHALRIYEFNKSTSIVLTRAEKYAAVFISSVGFLTIAALYAISFALTRSTPYWEFFGGLIFASYCAVFTDFLVAHAINSKS